MRSKNWKLARACASPALRRLCLISMMTIDRPETAAEFFARRSKGRAVGDLDRILAKVPDRPPEPGDELKAGRPIAYIAGNRRGCRDRQSVVWGKRVSVRGELGGGWILKKK